MTEHKLSPQQGRMRRTMNGNLVYRKVKWWPVLNRTAAQLVIFKKVSEIKVCLISSSKNGFHSFACIEAPGIFKCYYL